MIILCALPTSEKSCDFLQKLAHFFVKVFDTLGSHLRVFHWMFHFSLTP